MGYRIAKVDLYFADYFGVEKLIFVPKKSLCA
jgi:hypothetical protein